MDEDSVLARGIAAGASPDAVCSSSRAFSGHDLSVARSPSHDQLTLKDPSGKWALTMARRGRRDALARTLIPPKLYILLPRKRPTAESMYRDMLDKVHEGFWRYIVVYPAAAFRV